MRNILLTLLLFPLFSSSVGAVSVPHTFQPNTPALAAEVNANFQALVDAVNSQQAAITQLQNELASANATISQLQSDLAAAEAGIANNASDIASNAAAIATNATDIATNAAGISTNSSGIATNTTNISTNASGIATNAGDISTNASGIATNTADISTNASAIAANTANVSTNGSGIATNTADISANASTILDIQANSVLQLDGFLFLDSDPSGRDIARFDQVNVQITNGLGATNGDPFALIPFNPGPTNGLGNLVIGYNETSDSSLEFCSDGAFDNQIDCENNGFVWDRNQRSGSHNLVLGVGHGYTNHGGLLAGTQNIVNGPWGTVSGGRDSTASGFYSSVLGGLRATASSTASTVSGGRDSVASGFYSSVSGGNNNTASGTDTSVSGGVGRTAAAPGCMVGDDGVDC